MGRGVTIDGMAVFAETPALDAGEPRAFHWPTCSLPLSPPCAPQRDTEAAAVRAAGRSTADVLDVTDLDGSLAEDAETPLDFEANEVDIDTDGRLAITATTREALRDEPGNWDPRHVGKAARMGMRELVAERMLALGMAGHAGDYEPLTLEQMRDRYAAGTSAVV